jgi:hypothetical protein
MAARLLIGANVSVTPEQVAASDFDPREKARQVRKSGSGGVK